MLKSLAVAALLLAAPLAYGDDSVKNERAEAIIGHTLNTGHTAHDRRQQADSLHSYFTQDEPCYEIYKTCQLGEGVLCLDPYRACPLVIPPALGAAPPSEVAKREKGPPFGGAPSTESSDHSLPYGRPFFGTPTIPKEVGTSASIVVVPSGSYATAGPCDLLHKSCYWLNGTLCIDPLDACPLSIPPPVKRHDEPPYTNGTTIGASYGTTTATSLAAYASGTVYSTTYLQPTATATGTSSSGGNFNASSATPDPGSAAGQSVADFKLVALGIAVVLLAIFV